MDSSRYRRVREIFARATELRPSDRERLLDESCGGDTQLRQEVDDLLRHHFDESIVGDAGAPVLVHAPDAEPSATQSRLRLFLHRRYRHAAIVAASLGLLVLGWWTHGRVESAVLRMRAEEFENTLASKAAAFEIWVRERKAQLRMLAREPEFRTHALELLRLGEAGKAALPALKASPDRQALIDYVKPHLEDLGYNTLEIYDRRGFQVFATFDEYAGDQLNENGLALLARVLAGESLFEKPYRVETMFERFVPGTLNTVFGVPIRDDEGRVQGAISAVRPAYGAFAEILADRLGETGEVYAFDESGLMLTPSPYVDELRELGLLPAPAQPSRDRDVGTPLNLRLRDPGRRLTRDAPASSGGTVLPLTRLASTALARGPVDDTTTLLLEPYRNYRGAEVVGAWRWLPEYGMAVAVEMETAEAFAPIGRLDTTFGILLGLLSLSVAGGLLTSFKAARLRSRLHDLKQLGQYHLLELIGEGGMGKVYLAEHAGLKRRTAVKILSPALHSAEAIARFEREVVVSSQLTHPNTIEIYDYGRTADGVFYYAMEYVDGLSLAELVSRFGPLPAERAIYLLEQVCHSLKEAHGHGIVHRDIKPLNIMVCCRGGICDVVKVLDFGLAKLVENTGGESLTKPAHVGGTLMYMAPERFTSPRGVDARADIYSLGGVAYYLLTGRPPFEAVHDLDLVHQIASVKPKLPSEVFEGPVPPELEQLVMECLEKSPDERPASVDDIKRRLSAMRATGEWSEDEATAWWSKQGLARA